MLKRRSKPAPLGSYLQNQNVTQRPGYVAPDASIDARYGDRWFGPGAIGRFLPGPQSAFPKPRPQDYALTQPSEFAPFVDWSQIPQNAFKGDEQNSLAVDYGGEWDYQKPWTDPNTGQKLGPDLKPLPVPRLVPQTPVEHRRYAEAEARRADRLAHRERILASRAKA